MHKAKVIDGKRLAWQLRRRVKVCCQELRDRYSLVPGLAVILVGHDPASEIYVRNKERMASEVGIRSFRYDLGWDVQEREVLELVGSLNRDPSVNGILVQLPLPKAISTAAIMRSIRADKDVDGFHENNVGRLWIGYDGLQPCTPSGCLMLLRQVVGDLTGLHAVVVGASNIVGKPLAGLLLKAGCTVTVGHVYTTDLPAVCRSGDLLLVAVGKPGLVRGDWIKPGATVVDIGVNRVTSDVDGKQLVVGDVVFEEALAVAGAVTPVPGGVGPMTIAYLLRNTLFATCEQRGIEIDRCGGAIE